MDGRFMVLIHFIIIDKLKTLQEIVDKLIHFRFLLHFIRKLCTAKFLIIIASIDLSIL